MLKSIKVRAYMARHQLTFKAETDLFTAIGLLLEHRCNGAPVVDAGGNLIGILTESDCLKGILTGAYFEDAHGMVGSIMSSPVDSIDADCDIISVANRLQDTQYQQFPVTSEGRLVGVISRTDVLRAVKEFAQHDCGGNCE